MDIQKVRFPRAYNWLRERSIVGHSAFSQLQPWFLLKEQECFWANEKWPNVTGEHLLVFARRQDNDDLACFRISGEGYVDGVYLVHGWTPGGFEIIQSFPNVWVWLHTIIDDIEERVEGMDSPVV